MVNTILLKLTGTVHFFKNGAIESLELHNEVFDWFPVSQRDANGWSVFWCTASFFCQPNVVRVSGIGSEIILFRNGIKSWRGTGPFWVFLWIIKKNHHQLDSILYQVVLLSLLLNFIWTSKVWKVKWLTFSSDSTPSICLLKILTATLAKLKKLMKCMTKYNFWIQKKFYQ